MTPVLAPGEADDQGCPTTLAEVRMSRVCETVAIGERRVGWGQPVFVIAEAGVNHDGDVRTALELVDVAAAAGADAVKFQTFVPSSVAVARAPLADYQRAHVDGVSEQRGMLERLCLPARGLRSIAEHCRRRQLLFLSTPFDLPSAALLERLDVPAFKIASSELTNLPFLAALARRGLPMIVSTGMAALQEVVCAVDVVRGAGAQLILLHCVSGYPTPAEQVNLRAIDTLQAAFGTPVGFSDHTLGLDASLAAVARDACLLERHVTLDRNRRGPDHAISLEPAELAELVRRVRVTEGMLGDGRKRPQPAELDTRAVARRSIVAARPLAAGDTLTSDALAVKRPGGGLEPARMAELVGARLLRALAEDEQLTEAHLERSA
jgi:N,N'-diacetyllegionaminate synthase